MGRLGSGMRVGASFQLQLIALLAHGGGGRGNVLHHVKKKGELSLRGNLRGIYVRGGNVLHSKKQVSVTMLTNCFLLSTCTCHILNKDY